jgi:hypothetical protein
VGVSSGTQGESSRLSVITTLAGTYSLCCAFGCTTLRLAVAFLTDWLVLAKLPTSDEDFVWMVASFGTL